MKHALQGAPWLSAMARVFDRAGAELYIVGGAVRNPLLGLPLSDVDVCGPALVNEVCALCEGTEVEAVVRAAAFGTVELYVTDENGERQMAEYTTWREDCYGSGHKPDQVRFTKDIRVDARRRDFSINALYQRVHDGWLEEVLDPTLFGLSHLKDGVVYTTTADPDHILGNDGQRILRAVRFKAEMGFRLTPNMMDSLSRNAGLVRELTAERIASEVKKILMADLRYPMLHRRHPSTANGLNTLRKIGVWADVFGSLPFDPQALQAMEKLGGTLPERAALLCRHAPDAEEALRRIGLREDDRTQALAILQALASGGDLLTLARAGLNALSSALRILHALGENADRLQAAQQQLSGKPLSLKELAVNGNDLWPILSAQGREKRELGRTLTHLWQLVLEGKVQNRQEELLEAAKQGFCR